MFNVKIILDLVSENKLTTPDFIFQLDKIFFTTNIEMKLCAFMDKTKKIEVQDCEKTHFHKFSLVDSNGNKCFK